MTIEFFNPISEDFHMKLPNASYVYGKIEMCIDNIHNFVSTIKTFYGLHKWDLERCHVQLLLGGLESYGKKFRK